MEKSDYIPLLVLGGILLYWLSQKKAESSQLQFTEISPGDGIGEAVPQSFTEQVLEIFQPELMSNDATVTARRQAFLATIRAAEGTDQYADPYSVIFGGIDGSSLGFADHPGNLGFTQWQTFTVGGKTDYSTASGAYQFKLATWNALKKRLNLPDFSPRSQDIAALELVREKGALSDVDNGDVLTAAKKVATVWASLPGAPYGQPTRNESFIVAVYNNALSSA